MVGYADAKQHLGGYCFDARRLIHGVGPAYNFLCAYGPDVNDVRRHQESTLRGPGTLQRPQKAQQKGTLQMRRSEWQRHELLPSRVQSKRGMGSSGQEGVLPSSPMPALRRTCQKAGAIRYA